MVERNIPMDSIMVADPESDAVAYLSQSGTKLLLKMYRGRRSKPEFYFSYSSEEVRNRRMTEYFNERREAAKAKKERSAPHSLTVGTILCASWGYNCTIVSFYQVVETKTKSVVLRRINSEITENHHAYGKSMPVRDNFSGEPMTKRADANGTVRIGDSQFAYVWNGKAMGWTTD